MRICFMVCDFFSSFSCQPILLLRDQTLTLRSWHLLCVIQFGASHRVNKVAFESDELKSLGEDLWDRCSLCFTSSSRQLWPKAHLAETLICLGQRHVRLSPAALVKNVQKVWNQSIHHQWSFFFFVLWSVSISTSTWVCVLQNDSIFTFDQNSNFFNSNFVCIGQRRFPKKKRIPGSSGCVLFPWTKVLAVEVFFFFKSRQGVELTEQI